MLFVIYGHVVKNWTAYFVFTSPIKISLFFAVTGYVFNDCRSTKDFYINLVKKLVLPWLLLGMSVTVLLTPFKGIPYFLEHLKALITGKSFWYMPCCIIAEIIWFHVLKFCKKEKWVIVASITFFAAGLLFAKHSILNVCMISVSFVVQFYILIGYIYKKHESKIAAVDIWTPALGVIAYILLCIITLAAYPGQCLDIHTNRYYNIPICILLIYVGCLTAFYLASKVRKFPRCLLLIGQNTLVIYIFHDYVLEVFKRILTKAGSDYQNWTIAIILTLCTAAMCCFAAWLIDLLAPELLGKKGTLYNAKRNN